MQTERGEDMTGLGVHKIGGTSMSAVETVVDDIVIGERAGGDLYNRVFVVSAYGGLTDLLLEHKKTGEPGVYALYAGSESEAAREAALTPPGPAMPSTNRPVLGAPHHIPPPHPPVRPRLAGARPWPPPPP